MISYHWNSGTRTKYQMVQMEQREKSQLEGGLVWLEYRMV